MHMHFGLHCCISTTTTPASRRKEEEEGRASTETKQLTYFQSTYLEDSQSFSSTSCTIDSFPFPDFFLPHFLLYDSAHSCDCLISFPITLQNSELFDNFFVVPFHVIFFCVVFILFSSRCCLSLYLLISPRTLWSRNQTSVEERRREKKNTTRIC